MFKKAYIVVLSILICERLDHAIQPELSNVQAAIKTLSLPPPAPPNPGPERISRKPRERERDGRQRPRDCIEIRKETPKSEVYYSEVILLANCRAN